MNDTSTKRQYPTEFSAGKAWKTRFFPMNFQFLCASRVLLTISVFSIILWAICGLSPSIVLNVAIFLRFATKKKPSANGSKQTLDQRECEELSQHSMANALCNFFYRSIVLKSMNSLINEMKWEPDGLKRVRKRKKYKYQRKDKEKLRNMKT